MIEDSVREIIENEDYGDSVKIFKLTNLVTETCREIIGEDDPTKEANETRFIRKEFARNDLREEQRELLEKRTRQ